MKIQLSGSVGPISEYYLSALYFSVDANSLISSVNKNGVYMCCCFSSFELQRALGVWAGETTLTCPCINDDAES